MNSSGENAAETSETSAVIGYSLLGAIPLSMLLFLPMFVGGFVTDLGFSERSAGHIASINIAGSGLAAFAAFWWVRNHSIRSVVFFATVGFIALNFLSVFIDDFVTLIIVRLLEGIAAGTLSSGIIVAIGKTNSPDRNFGIWLAAQLLYGTIGFLVIPELFTRYGVSIGFGMIAGLGLLALPLARYLPGKGEQVESEHITASFKLSNHPLWGVSSIFIFYVGLNIVWAYLERIGNQAGLSIETIGASLSIANFSGLAGAIFVVVIGNKFGRLWPIAIALVLTSASLMPLLGTPSALLYGGAVSIYLFGWIFLVPLMLGAISEQDESGKYVALANAALAVGLALGPLVGSQLVGQSGNYTLSIYFSSGLILLSLFVILPIVLKRDDISG